MHPIWQILTTRRAAPLRYLSLCSGIEAATEAWHPLGWVPVAFAEVEPFPSAVLAHHWPHVPNLGDMTKWREWDEEMLASADVVVAGCPCQAFSVAGLRNSLDDERGNLTLIYVHILDHIDSLRAARGLPPVIIVYENVPGLLSTKDNAFGCFLGALAGEDEALVPSGKKWSNAGYVRGPQRAIAWRTLDAQYFGVAQRRRRVFLIAGAGDRICPAAVLFESEGVRRDTPPRRETGEGATYDVAHSTAGGGLGTDFDCDGGVIQSAVRMVAFGEYADDGTASTLKSRDYKDATDLVTYQGGENVIYQDSEFGVMEYPTAGTIRAGRIPEHQMVLEPAVAYGVDIQNQASTGDIAGTLCGESMLKGGQSGLGVAVAFDQHYQPDNITPSLLAGGSGGRNEMNSPTVFAAMAVRRLTPTECARLQGFPDFHCRIPWRGKPAEDCPDGPQYKSYGNSMATPCMGFIGRRIQMHLKA